MRDNYGTTEYTYDADGRRTSKTRNGATEQYIWDGDQLVVKLGTEKITQFTLSTSKGTDVRMPKLVEGQTYGLTVNGASYTAKAKKTVGEDDGPIQITRARPDDTEIPVLPPVTGKTRILLEFGPVSMEMEVNENPTTDGLVNVYVIGPANTAIALYDGDPALGTATYIRGLSLVAAVKDGVRTYYHYNAHGDVVQLTNSSGTVTKNYTYDAFGVEQNASDGDANPFRYCGEQFDNETGNYYLRARYYSPNIGRFTQEDPIMDGLNWYTYCAGNPVAYRDPSGESAYALEWGATTWGLTLADGPLPIGDAIYGIGLTVATLIDLVETYGTTYPTESISVPSTSTSRGGGGFTKSDSKDGGFSKEASSSKSTSQSAISGSGTAGGGPRRDDDDKDHMIGEKGAQFSSKTTGKSGGAHIDVENPNPGKRHGDIHYQAPDGTKWRYDIKTQTLIHPKTHEMAPPAIQRVLHAPWVVDAIKKALKYLGE